MYRAQPCLFSITFCFSVQLGEWLLLDTRLGLHPPEVPAAHEVHHQPGRGRVRRRGGKPRHGAEQTSDMNTYNTYRDRLYYIRWFLGCLNPASWLPLAAGREFTQPRAHSFAQLCIAWENISIENDELKFRLRAELDPFHVNLSTAKL